MKGFWLARARDLEKALAGSRPLGAFSRACWSGSTRRRRRCPFEKGGPPPRPKPQSQKREQRIHHGRGTHASMVDGTPPPDLARLEIRGGHRSSSSSESGSLDGLRRRRRPPRLASSVAVQTRTRDAGSGSRHDWVCKRVPVPARRALSKYVRSDRRRPAGGAAAPRLRASL